MGVDPPQDPILTPLSQLTAHPQPFWDTSLPKERLVTNFWVLSYCHQPPFHQNTDPAELGVAVSQLWGGGGLF